MSRIDVTTLGTAAGYRGGKVEVLVTYFNNLVDSFPRLVLILLVIAAFKPDIYYTMAVVGLTGVPVGVAAAARSRWRPLCRVSFPALTWRRGAAA